MNQRNLEDLLQGFGRSESGLFLPTYREPSSVGTPTHLAVTLGYQEIFSRSSSWAKVARRIRRYALSDILDVLGRISAALWSTSPLDVETQAKIARGLFGPHSSAVLNAAERAAVSLRDQGHRGAVVLFTQLQIIGLVKASFLVDGNDSTREEVDLACLGEALLMVTNLVGDGDLPTGGLPSTDGANASWQSYFIANGLFHHDENPVHSMARAYRLYVSDRDGLREHPNYLSLPERLREGTGLEPQTLWSALFALVGYWSDFDVDSLMHKAGNISADTYFTGELNFTREESEAFLSLIVSDEGKLRAEVATRYSPENLQLFDVLPFARWPLVRIGDRVYCCSFPLLFDRLVSGLHHIHLDPRVFASGERDRYLTYTGVVFEDSLTELRRFTFPAESGRLVTAAQLEELVDGTAICDGLLLYGDKVIVVEAKASLLTLGGRYGTDEEAYRDKLDDIFVDGLKQIQATIEAIETGAIAIPGVAPGSVIYLPLVVTLENMMMNDFLYSEISSRAARAGVGFGKNVAPWQTLLVGELELVDSVAESGYNLAELLYEKATNGPTKSVPFVNYCSIVASEILATGAHPLLQETYSDLAARTLAWAKARTSDTPPPTTNTSPTKVTK